MRDLSRRLVQLDAQPAHHRRRVGELALLDGFDHAGVAAGAHHQAGALGFDAHGATGGRARGVIRVVSQHVLGAHFGGDAAIDFIEVAHFLHELRLEQLATAGQIGIGAPLLVVSGSAAVPINAPDEIRLAYLAGLLALTLAAGAAAAVATLRNLLAVTSDALRDL